MLGEITDMIWRANGDSVANETNMAIVVIIPIAAYRIMPTTSVMPPLLRISVTRSRMPAIRRAL
ncbi:unnamed protein product, partial [marine sediment metagenome]